VGQTPGCEQGDDRQCFLLPATTTTKTLLVVAKRRTATTMMTAKNTAEEYAFCAPDTSNETFEPEGYGPFLVRRAELINDIIVRRANPRYSIHING
jgi:hypothetical protein